MRKVRPTPENTNSRNYYIEVLDIDRWQPYNYLVCFRDVEGYNSQPWYGRYVPTYYVALLAPPEKLVEAVTVVNDLFCEDDLRVVNSDSRPELMVPIPMDPDEFERLYHRKPYGEQRSLSQRVWDHLTDTWTDFPTDKDLTTTRLNDIVERVAARWILT